MEALVADEKTQNVVSERERRCDTVAASVRQCIENIST